MDLGATVCLPRTLCAAVPGAAALRGAARGHARALSGATRKLKRRRCRCGCCGCSGRRRGVAAAPPAPGVWAGLYCLPVFDSRALSWSQVPSVCRAGCGRARIRACADPQGPAPASGAPRWRAAPICATRDGGAVVRQGDWPGLGCRRRCANCWFRPAASRRRGRVAARRRVQLAVPAQRGPAVGKQPGQFLHQVHRAVLAAGAADGDGHIAAVVVGQGVQPGVQELGDVQHQLAHLVMLLEEGATGASRPVSALSSGS
jgi:hypothetical protein